MHSNFSLGLFWNKIQFSLFSKFVFVWISNIPWEKLLEKSSFFFWLFNHKVTWSKFLYIFGNSFSSFPFSLSLLLGEKMREKNSDNFFSRNLAKEEGISFSSFFFVFLLLLFKRVENLMVSFLYIGVGTFFLKMFAHGIFGAFL